MFKRIRKLFLLSTIMCASFAQEGYNHYVVLKETLLSSSAEVITIQQPATNNAYVQFEGISVYSSVAIDFTLEQNGTAATTTAVTPTPINGVVATNTKAFRSSNVGSSTVIGKYSVPAGGTITLGTSVLYLSEASTANNLTVRTASGSGTVRIIVQWKEK